MTSAAVAAPVLHLVDSASFCSFDDEIEQNQEKDSGVDCSPETIVLPDGETALKIRKVVESFFADENIVNDPFLLKHVKRNKEGFVSLKLISSFKKVRSLCRNWKSVAHCLQGSEYVAVNSEGTKVRRQQPLPDETQLSKTIVAYPLPADKVSIDAISKLFASCGPIASVRVLRQGCVVAPSIKRFFTKNPEAQSKDCGLVEFEEFAGAQKALTLPESDKIKDMQVLTLILTSKDTNSSKESSSPKRESPKKRKKTKRSLLGSKKNLDDSENDMSVKKEQRSRRSSSGSLGYSSSSSSGYLSSSPVDNWFLRRHSYHTTATYLEPTTKSFASLANRTFTKSSKERINKEDNKNTAKSTPIPESPWRRRQKSENPEHLSTNVCIPIKTLRFPRGPDGTKGFQPRLSTSKEE